MKIYIDLMSIGTQHHPLIVTRLFCQCDEISLVIEVMRFERERLAWDRSRYSMISSPSANTWSNY